MIGAGLGAEAAACPALAAPAYEPGLPVNCLILDSMLCMALNTGWLTGSAAWTCASMRAVLA